MKKKKLQKLTKSLCASTYKTIDQFIETLEFCVLEHLKLAELPQQTNICIELLKKIDVEESVSSKILLLLYYNI